jgi:RimJ/RimL family protein N-acetyltransferase
MRFYNHPFSRDEVVAWIERWRASYRRNAFGLWALELKESGAFVGDTGLTFQEVEPGETMVEVGWHVHRDHQRRGLATEAARASLSYVLDRAEWAARHEDSISRSGEPGSA